ncbi:MAG: PAS domain S-box protein [Gemmatales bacterium]
MSSAKRILLMMAALLPTVMVVCAAWMVGMSWQLIFAAISAAAISLIITFVATIGPRRHQDALDQITLALQKNDESAEQLVGAWKGAQPPPWSMAALTMELCRRLAERRYQLKQTMHDVINALASLAHPLNPPCNLSPPPCPDQDEGRMLSSTYHIHLKNFQTLRTRELALSTLMKDMPLPLIATDLELKIHYVNNAAEKLIGQSAAELQNKTLTRLLVEPPDALLSNDVTLPHGMGPKVFYAKLLENKLKNLTVWLKIANGKLVPVNVITKLGQHHVFQLVPLADPVLEPVSSSPAAAKQLAAI